MAYHQIFLFWFKMCLEFPWELDIFSGRQINYDLWTNGYASFRLTLSNKPWFLREIWKQFSWIEQLLLFIASVIHLQFVKFQMILKVVLNLLSIPNISSNIYQNINIHISMVNFICAIQKIMRSSFPKKKLKWQWFFLGLRTSRHLQITSI